MHCPKCGQQQASQDERFCSRSGFRLAFVSELLVNDGIPAKTGSTEEPGTLTERRRRYRVGGKILFLGLAVIPIAIVLSVIFDSPVPLLIFTCPLLIGILIMLYSRLFIEKSMPAPISEQDSRTMNTAELRQPPSVTENTTRLLDKDNL